MRIVKRLNNNAVLCVDDDGRQVIALGRGLSTIPLSSDLDLNLVIRTFYDIEPRYIDLLRDLPIEKVADFERMLIRLLESSDSDVLTSLRKGILNCANR